MLPNDWDIILEDIFEGEDFKKFYKKIKEDYDKYILYPKFNDIFKALELTSYENTKVVILGQDPYYNPNQANGLAFSLNSGQKITPSLRNIFKELKDDLGIENNNVNLESWAEQGVLLLNSILTVREKKPGFYKNSYWQYFTDEIIKRLAKKGNIIFLLRGNYAKTKVGLIDDTNIILSTSHPSPLSFNKGFNGSKIFSRTNDILERLKKEKIDWKT